MVSPPDTKRTADRAVQRAVRPAKRLRAGHGSSDAWQLAGLIQAGRPAVHVIVCAQSTDCARLLAEIAWFAPELRIAGLPDWETLPYDHLSPHQDLVSERLSAMYALLSRRLDVLVEGPSRTDPSVLRGRSRHGKVVNFTGLASPGEIVPVQVTRATSQTLGGELSLLARALA